MGITMTSGMQHAVTFAIPAAMPAHDPGDAAPPPLLLLLPGEGAPAMRIREVS